jgi:Tol biopolymer transport system component
VPPPSPDRFGPYEVVELLGTGGMGEVYRARDPRLNRQVAIKVLARAGADAARHRHLLEEAQAASALNHPNIVTVYDVGTHDEVPYIVSELVEGSSLRQLLARGPLSPREVLDLSVQMADGLAAAHAAGIVHRDFKPENVMVTRDGRLKILDFGLAIVGSRDGAPVPSSEATVTIAGMIMGTVPYMSPEQARGATVDYRTDQFSLGLTIYELLTRRRAFAAETAAQVLAAIIEDEPEPIAAIAPRVPVPLRWIVERCLSKDPRQRYESTGDLARDLRTIRDRFGEISAQPDLAPADGAPPGRRRLTIAFAAAAAVLIVAAAALIPWKGADSGLDRYRFTPLATDAGYQASPAWSPDGKTLAYVASVSGVLQVFTKPAGSPTRNQVTRARFDCRDPMWSADGTRIYYISLARDREGLYSISAAGGDPEPVMEDVYRAALSPDGKTLAFFREAPEGLRLWLSSPVGAEPKLYSPTPFDKEADHIEATLHFAPDGTKLGAWMERGEGTSLEAEFWVLPFDAAPFRATQPSRDIVGLAPAFTWLPDSRHVLSALPRPTPGMHLWLMDTGSGVSRLITATGGMENDPALSPDGTRLALTFQQADYDLYELSLDRPAPAPALATSRSEMDPASRPDRTEIAFATDRTGRAEIWLRSQKGDWEERPLVTPSDFSTATYLLSAPAFSPDGQTLAYNRGGPEGMQIWFSAVNGGPPIQLGLDKGAQDWPSWSPDGAWVAFGQGVDSPWVVKKKRPGAQTPAETIASDMAAFSPLQWSPDGRWIVYNSVNGLALVSPDGKATRPLHELSWMAFAWSADSQRVYGIRLSDDSQHLSFVSVDVRSGDERMHGPDFMPLPVASRVVRGMTRTSPTTFLASIVHVRSDVWLLENFLPAKSLWDRLRAALPRGRR